MFDPEVKFLVEFHVDNVRGAGVSNAVAVPVGYDIIKIFGWVTVLVYNAYANSSSEIPRLITRQKAIRARKLAVIVVRFTVNLGQWHVEPAPIWRA